MADTAPVDDDVPGSALDARREGDIDAELEAQGPGTGDLPSVVADVLAPLIPQSVQASSFVPTPGDDGSASGETRRWWGHHLSEMRCQLELARLSLDPLLYSACGVPRGDGGPVVLIPGFLAGDPSLSVLGGWLLRIGHRPYRSGIWLNVDCSDRALDRLERRVERIVDRRERKVALVGHSRGGLFAKALARRRPDLVERVVSMGAALDRPFDISIPTRGAIAGVRSALTATSSRARAKGCLTESCDCPFTRDFCSPFPSYVAITSIYSRSDGVVWWPSCRVPYARNVAVRSSHVGLVFNRHAYRAVADALAPSTAVEPPVDVEAVQAVWSASDDATVTAAGGA